MTVAFTGRLPGAWRGVFWAWQRGDEGGGISRGALLWRAIAASLMHRAALRRWMAVVHELHSRGLVADLPGEFLRAVRPSVHRHTDVSARVVQLIDHVDWMEGAFRGPAFETLCADQPLVLANLPPPCGYESMVLQLQRAPVQAPEGELLLTLALKRSPAVQHKAVQVEAAAVGFSVFRIDGSACLAIGGVRGPRHPVQRVSAMELTQAMSGWKPSVLMVRVAQELAAYWSLKLVGLNPSSHRLQGWRYQLSRRHRDAGQRIYGSYDALWDHFDATKGPNGWMVLPRESDDKLAATALSPEKRARQILRADFWIRTRRQLHIDSRELLQRPARAPSLSRVTQSEQSPQDDEWDDAVAAATGSRMVPAKLLETGPGSLI